jgi:hypothetical protein
VERTRIYKLLLPGTGKVAARTGHHCSENLGGKSNRSPARYDGLCWPCVIPIYNLNYCPTQDRPAQVPNKKIEWSSAHVERIRSNNLTFGGRVTPVRRESHCCRTPLGRRQGLFWLDTSRSTPDPSSDVRLDRSETHCSSHTVRATPRIDDGPIVVVLLGGRKNLCHRSLVIVGPAAYPEYTEQRKCGFCYAEVRWTTSRWFAFTLTTLP